MSMFRLEITIDDLALLSEDDFWLVWTQLGVLVRAKGIFQREGSGNWRGYDQDDCRPADTGQQTRACSHLSAGVDERPGGDKSDSPSREAPAVIGAAPRAPSEETT